MSHQDVKDFLKKERKVLKEFRRNVIRSLRVGAPGDFKYDIWNAWYEHIERIEAFNNEIKGYSQKKLCESLLTENVELSRAISALTAIILDPGTNPEPERHLKFIRASLCSTHTSNQRILEELSCGVTMCKDLDNTSPDCTSTRSALLRKKSKVDANDESKDSC